MSLHRKCCCGCNSFLVVLEPCDETNEDLYLRRPVVSVLTLEVLYGEDWRDMVFHYNGQCNCAPFCGRFVCKNNVKMDGPNTNVCMEVPCDAPTYELICPDCDDETYEGYVFVRPNDFPNRFTPVEDCCDDSCNNECEPGNPVDLQGCNVFTHGDFIYHPPTLATSTASWNALGGRASTATITSIQVVGEEEPDPSSSSSYKSWHMKCTASMTCDNSTLPSGSPWRCGQDILPSSEGTCTFYVSIYVTPCSLGTNQEQTASVVGPTGIVGGGQPGLTDVEWPNNSGDFYPRSMWEVCPEIEFPPTNPENVGVYLDGSYYNQFDRQYTTQAYWGGKADFVFTLGMGMTGGYPWGFDSAADFEAFNGTLSQITTSITYPPDPNP